MKSSWQGRATAITTALLVSDNVTTFLEKLTRTVHHSDHQLDGDTRLVPNYPCWISGKNTPSLDKWTLFSGINTNSLIQQGPSSHLILETHFQLSSLHSLCYSLQPITFTLNLYCVITDFIIWAHLAGTTSVSPPFFFSHHVVSKHVFLRKY